MDSIIKSVFAMAVYSVCSTRMASAEHPLQTQPLVGSLLFQMAILMQDKVRKL